MEVASRAEAWIETQIRLLCILIFFVASRAEAWIETRAPYPHPDRGGVASRAEAWIETGFITFFIFIHNGRLPCGGVD